MTILIAIIAFIQGWIARKLWSERKPEKFKITVGEGTFTVPKGTAYVQIKTDAGGGGGGTGCASEDPITAWTNTKGNMVETWEPNE